MQMSPESPQPTQTTNAGVQDDLHLMELSEQDILDAFDSNATEHIANEDASENDDDGNEGDDEVSEADEDDENEADQDQLYGNHDETSEMQIIREFRPSTATLQLHLAHNLMRSLNAQGKEAAILYRQRRALRRQIGRALGAIFLFFHHASFCALNIFERQSNNIIKNARERQPHLQSPQGHRNHQYLVLSFSTLLWV